MENKQFKAFRVKEVEKGVFERNIVTRNIEDLPEGDVTIQVKYSSINYKDALSSIGNKGVTRRFPHTPGIDAAGIVVESSNPKFNTGDNVLVTSYDLGMNTDGGYGEYIRVPSDWVVKLPTHMSYKEAMAYGTAGLTAAISVYKMIGNGVKPEDGDILVTGSTGGVGSVAVALLSKLGYSVVGVSGKEAGRETLLKLGAKDMILRKDFDDESGRPMLKEQWAGVIDTVGGNILATALKTTKHNGSVTACGNVASPDLPTSVFPFILRGISLLGVDSQNFPMVERQLLWDKLAGEWNLENLEETTTEITLEELDTNLQKILKGQLVGRTVVKIG